MIQSLSPIHAKLNALTDFTSLVSLFGSKITIIALTVELLLFHKFSYLNYHHSIPIKLNITNNYLNIIISDIMMLQNTTIFTNLIDTIIHNLIQIGSVFGYDNQQIKTIFINQFHSISKTKTKNNNVTKKTKKTKKFKHKAVRPPLWISDSSDNDS